MKKINVKVSVLLVMILLLIMVFSSCTKKDGEPTTNDSTNDNKGKAVEKVFNTILGGNPTSLDPIIFRDANANSIINATHEPLVRFDESGMGYEPGLAEKVEHNEDATVWTFTLREGAMWSDGTPVTTEDIVYSFQRPLNPEMNSPNVNDFFIFKNAEAIYSSRTESEDADPIEDLPYEDMGVRAEGNKIIFTLEKPTDYFIDYVRTASFAPVQKKAAEEYGALYGTDLDKIVCSGPFTLTSWDQEVSMTLEKNPNYWDADNVKLSRVEITLAKDANTIQSLYDTEAIDFMTISQEVADAGKYDNVSEVRKLSTQIIQFNSHKEIEGVAFNYFQNEKIREALGLTFDRQAFVNDVVKQPKGAAYGLVPYGMRGENGGDFREQQGDLVYDMHNFPGGSIDGKTYASGKEGAIDRAKDLFAEGLAECGKTKEQFEQEAEFVLPNAPGVITNVQAMQAMWKQYLGVNVLMKPLEMANLMPYIIGGTYQCLIGGGPTGSTYDAGEFLGFIYNEKQWESEEYNALWEKTLVATGDERIKLIKECEKMACDAYLYIPMTFKYVNYVQRENVTGLRMFSVGLEYDYKYVDIIQ
ncbi:peptide ABC transporter substrate-binding protein [Vallitalea longa]|uniref:Peptide ABC transporter substrate-binding protein n=1 Tax=Vallitalea longa TaxID=2936439 RepID=A0A9W5YBP6_9FIRM|nr:peptide ABC transporter substrate-binding protein [Vallitalea longa]GKX28333.1 peptide ABC transporter substrate-binding protein [Vallitalea longa]